MRMLRQLSILLFCVMLAGCVGPFGGKIKERAQHKRKHRQHDVDKKSKASFLFLDTDEADDFVIEDEVDTDPFAVLADEEDSISLVPQELDRDQYEARKAEQVQYGFKTIYFNFDDDRIRPDQQHALKHDVEVAKKLTKKGKTVVIEGYSCKSAGSPTYNMMLSEKRAQTVAKAFVNNDIPGEKIKVVGRGQEMCIVPYGNRDQQRPNRRVEFYALDPEEV